jgi:polar amino acid transport system substrate-binding protein
MRREGVQTDAAPAGVDSLEVGPSKPYDRVSMRIAGTSVVVGSLLVAVACAGRGAPPPEPAAHPKELVVGTSGDTPPYATRRGATIGGIEIDLAMEVGKVLDRPVRIVQVPWKDLFDALASGRIDVVMAGVTMTPERKARFAFTEPYLRTDIAVLVRHEDLPQCGSRAALCKGSFDIGVVGQTTGQRYLQEQCPAVVPRIYASTDDAVLDVANGKLDAVVSDGPVLAYLASQQAVDVDVVATRATHEELAWMVRKDDTALLEALNRALATLRKDGTLARVLGQWIPKADASWAP